MFKVRFTRLGFLIFVVVLSVLLGLGIWQLKRAEFKENLQFSHEQQQQHPLVSLSDLTDDIDKNLYRNVTLTGKYLKNIILLDNKMEKNKMGYHVFTPFLLEDNSVILINRGWVLMDNRRDILPEIETPEHAVNIKGQIRQFPNVAYRLNDPAVFNKHWPKVVQYIDKDRVSHWFKQSSYPFIIQLSADEDYGFARNWILVSTNPEMHVAYAIQWFAIAFIAFIIFLKRSIIFTRSNN